MARFNLRTAGKEIWESIRSPKRAIVLGIASILLLLGAVGTFIPLFPARLVAAPGVIVFSLYSPSVYASLKRKSQNHPRIQSVLDRVRNWVIHKLH